MLYFVTSFKSKLCLLNDVFTYLILDRHMKDRFKINLLFSAYHFYRIVLFQLNMFVMGLVVRKFLTLKAVARKTEVAKLRYCVHTNM